MKSFKTIFFLVLILFSVGTRYISSVYAQTSACPSADDLTPHLAAGWWGRVTSGLTHNLRADATVEADINAQVPDGDIFRVLDGPRCADNYVWWEVDYAGTTGWLAEGDAEANQYWLTPLDGQEVPDTEAENDTELADCEKPPEDYSRVNVNGATLNARTLAMLDIAQANYRAGGGIINFRTAVMQGSYNPGGVSASFGTHDAGGAIDLSVRDPRDHSVLTDEIEPMLEALRFAGFAAWLRDTDSLYPGSPIHVHAIAIGDAELSEAARGQLDGTFGYLRGYNGLPQDDGIPQPDTSGEMVLCQWMIDIGYQDMRAE
jgi:hypothetical protein